MSYILCGLNVIRSSWIQRHYSVFANRRWPPFNHIFLSQSHHLNKTMCINWIAVFVYVYMRKLPFFGSSKILQLNLRSRLKCWNQISNQCNLLSVFLLLDSIWLVVLTHLIRDEWYWAKKEKKNNKNKNISPTIAIVCASDAVLFLSLYKGDRISFFFCYFWRVFVLTACWNTHVCRKRCISFALKCFPWWTSERAEKTVSLWLNCAYIIG